MDHSVQMKLKFRCPPEYEGLIPQPVPAVLGLPDWYKAMPQNSFSPIARQDTFTLKKCPPFIDAMTYGFLIPLTVDLKVQDGEFSWDFDVPEGSSANIHARRSIFTTRARPRARRCSMTTASSSSSPISGPSRRRKVTRSCSPIRSIAATCRSRR